MVNYYKNLVPGQWQIGNLVMGKGTNVKVASVDSKSYDINNQDYQIVRTDEKRFGIDQISPTTIEFTFQVLHNRLLGGFEELIPNFWHSMPTVEDLAREWHADDVRQTWGAMKPIYLNSRFDEKEKIIFGRPGQFYITQNDMFAGGEVVTVTAEFRRGDALSHSLYQNSVLLNQADPDVNINGTNGRGPSWLKIAILGPVDNPILNFQGLYLQSGPISIELDYDISAGEIVEINAEPWSRRVVNNGTPVLNLASKLAGETPFLDKLRFNFDSTLEIGLEGTSMTSETQVLVTWRDTYYTI